MPIRIQRQRTRGWRMPAGTVYVGRPTRWGNPFRVSNGDCDHPDCGPGAHPPLTIDKVLDAYRNWVRGMIAKDPGFLEPLRGHDLACWCRPGSPCHADVLLEMANGPAAPGSVERSESVRPNIEAGEAELHRLQGMLVFAIATGTELKWVNHFREPATVQDLAKMEKAVDAWFRSTCRVYFKLKPRQIPRLKLDLQGGTWVDDGDNTVTITLDMGKVFPGERPPEVLAKAREMMEWLEARVVAAGGRPGTETEGA